jgi:hypothetical protein
MSPARSSRDRGKSRTKTDERPGRKLAPALRSGRWIWPLDLAAGRLDQEVRRSGASKIFRELRMNRKMFLTLAGAAVGAFMVYGSAQAAPATTSGSLDALKTLGVGQSQVEQARCWRRCWRRGGYWHCRRWCRRWWW